MEKYISYLNIGTAIIALLTVIIAWMTYLSQKKTQENTKYLIKSDKALKSYLINTFSKLIAIETFIFVIKENIDNSKLKDYIRLYSSNIVFDTSDFSDYFYDDESSFNILSLFKDGLESFNRNVNNFCIDIQNNDCSTLVINEYLSSLDSKLLALNDLCYYFMVNLLAYNRSNNKYKRFLLKYDFEKDQKLFVKKLKERKLFEYRKKLFAQAQEDFERIIINQINPQSNLKELSDVCSETFETVLTNVFYKQVAPYRKGTKFKFYMNWQHKILIFIFNDTNRQIIKYYLDFSYYVSLVGFREIINKKTV